MIRHVSKLVLKDFYYAFYDLESPNHVFPRPSLGQCEAILAVGHKKTKARAFGLRWSFVPEYGGLRIFFAVACQESMN